MGYTKMSEEEDNDINGLKMDELRKIEAARKEKEEKEKKKQEELKKKQEELKIRNEELKKRKEIHEKQQTKKETKKETLNVQKMLDKKHPEKAIKAYPQDLVNRAKKQYKKDEEKKTWTVDEDDIYYRGPTKNTYKPGTWNKLEPGKKLELLIQAAAEEAIATIDKTEKTAKKKTKEEEKKKAKDQKIKDDMLKKKKEQEKSLKTKELKKMQQHYPMDKVLNEAFLKEKLQKHVYTVFNIISNGGKLNKKEETGFHEFITDALWLTNSHKTAEYGDNQINTMNSLQSYVIFSNVLMMLQNLSKKQLGVTLEWCTNVVRFLDGCIEEGEIRTFYTPKLENNAHIRKHLMEELFDEDRISEIENFFNVRLEYATELGLDYEKLNLPNDLLAGPEWCQAIPIIGKDRPFTYEEDVPEAIIGKKIRLKKISESTKDDSGGIFYRVINDEKIGDLVVHKIVPFKKEKEEKEGEKVFESFLVHLDLTNGRAVEKIAPNKKKEEKEDKEEDAKLEKMDKKEEKELIAIETPSKETKWRQAGKKEPKDGRRVRVRTWQEGELRVLSDSKLSFKPDGSEKYEVIGSLENIEVRDQDNKWIEVVESIDKSYVRTIKYVEGEFKNGTVDSPFTFKPYGEKEWQVIDNKENIEVEDKSEDQLEVESAVRKAEEEELEKETEKNEEDEIWKELKKEEKKELEKELKKELKKEEKKEENKEEKEGEKKEEKEEEKKEVKEEKEEEKEEVKLDQGDYIDGQEFEIVEMSYPEFEPKTVFFDPRAFAFFIDILSPVLYEGDDVIFTDDDKNFHYGTIKSVTTGDDDELLYNILENETWSSTFSWSTTVSEKNIVGINHKHLNTGMHKHAVKSAITEEMKGNTFDDFSLSGQNIVGKKFRYYKDKNFKKATIEEYDPIDNKYKTSDGPDGARWYDLNNIVYIVLAFEVLDMSSDDIVGRKIEIFDGTWHSGVTTEFKAETECYIKFKDSTYDDWYDLTTYLYRIPPPTDDVSFDEIPSNLVLEKGLVFPYRTQQKEGIPIGTFVGLKLQNSKSKFEFAKSLDLEETRYYKTSLPHPVF